MYSYFVDEVGEEGTFAERKPPSAKPSRTVVAARVVNKADEVGIAAKAYYQLRHDLLIKEHQKKLEVIEDKKVWKKERHLKKLQVMHAQQQYYQQLCPSHSSYQPVNMYPAYEQNSFQSN